MALSVRLSDQLVKQAQIVSEVMHRSCAKQIEHWAMIGRLVEDNPDLPYEFILGSLMAKAEMDNDLVSDYEFTR
ncbi:MAG: ParD-like family protein [Francisellaceae bacterium]